MEHSADLERRLLEKISRIAAIDVHSHLPAASPCAVRLREILGYHYFTELAHSAGLNPDVLAADVPDEEMIPALIGGMENINNTVQYGWLLELTRELFGFDERLAASNWQELDRRVRADANRPGRAEEVLRKASVEKVLLTNSFDEDLEGIDKRLFVPSLRLDNLVFEFTSPAVRGGLAETTNVEVSGLAGLREAFGALVQRFTSCGARSLAIGVPPGLDTKGCRASDLEALVAKAVRGDESTPEEMAALAAGLLWEMTALCAEFGLPLQLMYGAIRGVYDHGVCQGQDLTYAGGSLAGLLPLLNGFPQVTFCVSVLSQSQAQELACYGWIVHNVAVSGHWWYLNIPAYIEGDLTARLQSLPKTKLIAYYSDAYKAEFILPKFNMYRRCMARVLARDFVEVGRGSETDALHIATLMLRENPRRIFNLDEGGGSA